MTADAPILDDAAVAGLLPSLDIAVGLRRMFGALAAGAAVQPPQSLTLFPRDAGDVICYLGVLADERVFGVKVSPYLVGLPGGALVTAWTLLMSMETGRPLLLCDAKRLTTERTAATTALAVDLLAPASVRRLAVVGTGPAAAAHIRHALPLRDWASIRVHARRGASLPQERLAALVGIDRRVEIVADADTAVDGADVVMLCTSAAEPVIDLARLGAPALVTSISTNVPGAHEIAPSALAAMDVYCDFAATTPASATEMRSAEARHGWSRDAIRGDLPGLVAGTAPLPRGDRQVYFRSIGLGLEDVAVAHELLLAHGRRAAAG